MTYFLKICYFLEGWTPLEFHKHQYGFDPIICHLGSGPNSPLLSSTGSMKNRAVTHKAKTGLEIREVSGERYPTHQRYIFHTPKRILTCVLQQNGIVRWQTEFLVIKENQMEIFCTVCAIPIWMEATPGGGGRKTQSLTQDTDESSSLEFALRYQQPGLQTFKQQDFIFSALWRSRI